MGQITIYLDSELETKMRTAIKSKHISQSKWIATLIDEKLKNDWPESVTELTGAWKDLPTAEEIRRLEGTDLKREEI